MSFEVKILNEKFTIEPVRPFKYDGIGEVFAKTQLLLLKRHLISRDGTIDLFDVATQYFSDTGWRVYYPTTIT